MPVVLDKTSALRSYVRTKLAATEASMPEPQNEQTTESLGAGNYFSTANESVNPVYSSARPPMAHPFPGDSLPPEPPKKGQTPDPVVLNVAHNTNKDFVGMPGAEQVNNISNANEVKYDSLAGLTGPFPTAKILELLKIPAKQRMSKLVAFAGPNVLWSYIPGIANPDAEAVIPSVTKTVADPEEVAKLSSYELMGMLCNSVLKPRDKTAGILGAAGKGLKGLAGRTALFGGGTAGFSTMLDPESMERHGILKTFGQKLVSPRTWAYGAGMGIGAPLIGKLGANAFYGAARMSGNKYAKTLGKAMTGRFTRPGVYAGLGKQLNRVGLSGLGAKAITKSKNISYMDDLVKNGTFKRALKDPNAMKVVTDPKLLENTHRYLTKFSKPGITGAGTGSDKFLKAYGMDRGTLEKFREGGVYSGLLDTIGSNAKQFGGSGNFQKAIGTATGPRRMMDMRNVIPMSTNVFHGWAAPAMIAGMAGVEHGPWTPSYSLTDPNSSAYNAFRGPAWEPFENHYQYNPYRAT